MQSTRLLSRMLLRRPAIRSSSSNVPAYPTMNDLPRPKGDWQTNYDALNRRYTIHLVLGVSVFAATLVFGKAAGYLETYNDYPEVPAEIENYKNL